MPPFKGELGPAAAERLATELLAAWPEFPTHRFVHDLARELQPRELLQRNELLADRLVATLPPRFEDAASVLWHALDSPTFTGWITIPCGTFVAKAGADEPATALPLLAGLTPRWSSEAAIRPFIERHPQLTYEYLRTWSGHPDEHVRRLVSESTRPRLPWARQLRSLVADPSPNFPLLDALVTDQSQYVRRSVANHLNDISKDHPDIAVHLARQWQGLGPGPAWVVRHGLRSLVKAGDAAALQLMGAAPDADIRLLEFSADRHDLTVGEAATFTCTLALCSGEPVTAIIDYRIHFVGARGVNRPKVFKMARRHLQAGRSTTVTKLHRFENVSIRRIHPWVHTIDLQINGRVRGSLTVEVAAAPDTSPDELRPNTHGG
jgi:3-methyladenine DNA glycosylase AlkC